MLMTLFARIKDSKPKSIPGDDSSKSPSDNKADETDILLDNMDIDDFFDDILDEATNTVDDAADSAQTSEQMLLDLKETCFSSSQKKALEALQVAAGDSPEQLRLPNFNEEIFHWFKFMQHLF